MLLKHSGLSKRINLKIFIFYNEFSNNFNLYGDNFLKKRNKSLKQFFNNIFLLYYYEYWLSFTAQIDIIRTSFGH